MVRDNQTRNLIVLTPSRDDLTNENRLLRSGLGVEQVDSSRVPQMSHSGDRGASSDTEGETKIEQEQHPELETSGSMGGPQGLQGAGGGDVRLESRTRQYWPKLMFSVFLRIQAAACKLFP